MSAPNSAPRSPHTPSAFGALFGAPPARIAPILKTAHLAQFGAFGAPTSLQLKKGFRNESKNCFYS